MAKLDATAAISITADRASAAAVGAPARSRFSRPDYAQPAPIHQAKSVHLAAWRRSRSGELAVDRNHLTHVIFTLTTPFDDNAFLGALWDLVRRHDVLRSFCEERNGEPFIRLCAGQPSLPMETADLSAAPAESRGQTAKDLARSWLWREFQLDGGLLWRVLVIRVSATETVVGLLMHHFLSDAASIDILRADLMHAYFGRVLGRPPPPHASIGYIPYLNRLWAWVEGPDGRRAGDALVEQFGVNGGLRPTEDAAYRITRKPMDFDAVEADQLARAARRLNTTPNLLLIAAQCDVLRALSGEERIAIGSVSSNRRQRQTARTAGYLTDRVYTLVDLTGARNRSDVAERAYKAILAYGAYESYPSDLLKSALEHRGRPLVAPLFNFKAAEPKRAVKSRGSGPVMRPFAVDLPEPRTRPGADFPYLIGMVGGDGGFSGSFVCNDRSYADVPEMVKQWVRAL